MSVKPFPQVADPPCVAPGPAFVRDNGGVTACMTACMTAVTVRDNGGVKNQIIKPSQY